MFVLVHSPRLENKLGFPFWPSRSGQLYTRRLPRRPDARRRRQRPDPLQHHANSAEQALARFSSCVVQSGIELPYQAVRYQIADAIHLVLHLGRHEGRRLVRELIRIGRYDVDHDRYETDELIEGTGLRRELHN